MPDRLVYSTDGGRVSICAVCGQAYERCRCNRVAGEAASRSPIDRVTDGIVRLMRDRKQRGGKTVTLISGVPDGEQAALAQQLKKLCGSGGTVKDGAIEIQGDHCDKVQGKLTELGYKVK